MSRRGHAGTRKPGDGGPESRPETAATSPPPTPTSSSSWSSSQLRGTDRKSLTDSVEDPGYISMSGSIATETDISKSTCSMMDSGLIEEDPPEHPHDHHHHRSQHPSSADDKMASSTKLDSGYIDAKLPGWELRLLETTLMPREIYAQDDDGDTLLHVACMEGWTQLLCKLLVHTPNPDLLDLRNDLGQTALHVAALCGHFHEARLLLVAGATVDARDHAGCTPLHVACRRGDLRVASDLLSPVTQKEADFLKLRYPVAVDNGPLDVGRLLLQRTYAGDTALHLAVRSGSKALVEELLRHTADPNIRERYCGATPLHLACRLERPDLVECLLATGRVRVNAEDYGRRTALGRAWDAHRSCPSSKALLRLVLLLRDHGGRPTRDPGSEDDDSEEEEGDSQEEEEEEEESYQVRRTSQYLPNAL
ncbi:unnamed protein product, partial [Ixodes hexagonus]